MQDDDAQEGCEPEPGTPSYEAMKAEGLSELVKSIRNLAFRQGCNCDLVVEVVETADQWGMVFALIQVRHQDHCVLFVRQLSAMRQN